MRVERGRSADGWFEEGSPDDRAFEAEIVAVRRARKWYLAFGYGFVGLLALAIGAVVLWGSQNGMRPWRGLFLLPVIGIGLIGKAITVTMQGEESLTDDDHPRL